MTHDGIVASSGRNANGELVGDLPSFREITSGKPYGPCPVCEPAVRWRMETRAAAGPHQAMGRKETIMTRITRLVCAARAAAVWTAAIAAIGACAQAPEYVRPTATTAEALTPADASPDDAEHKLPSVRPAVPSANAGVPWTKGPGERGPRG